MGDELETPISDGLDVSEIEAKMKSKMSIVPIGRRLNIIKTIQEDFPKYKSRSKLFLRPIKIDRIIKQQGYTIQYVKDIDAELKKYSKYKLSIPQNRKIEGFSLLDEKIIVVDDNLSLERKRFVAAHEIAHRILGHKDRGISFKSSQDVSPNIVDEEKINDEEADFTAAVLLMPHKDIYQHWDKKDNFLARKLGVNRKAIAYRRKEVYNESAYGYGVVW
jgi:Zn-dependent peptidase ImmA (M78 family)